MISGVHAIVYSKEADRLRSFFKDVLCLMCEDVRATIEKLKSKGIGIATPVADQGWGLVTRIELPDGSLMGLYQPKHPAPPRA